MLAAEGCTVSLYLAVELRQTFAEASVVSLAFPAGSYRCSGFCEMSEAAVSERGVCVDGDQFSGLVGGRMQSACPVVNVLYGRRKAGIEVAAILVPVRELLRSRGW